MSPGVLAIQHMDRGVGEVRQTARVIQIEVRGNEVLHVFGTKAAS
jgi:hypothetical protein